MLVLKKRLNGKAMYMVYVNGRSFVLPVSEFTLTHQVMLKSSRWQAINWTDLPEEKKQEIVNIEDNHSVGVYKRKEKDRR